MNFPFNVNHLFKEEITKVDSRLEPCRQNANRFGFQNLQQMLFEVVDRMGDASAKAQNLPGSITTGKRLETANQRLYVLKDASADEKTPVIGILKVGTKKLFVYDSCKVQRELDPLCILDFYVHESRQREGCGRKIFDFMLRSEGIRPEHLAIDRPSPKFLSFLKKHYSLHNAIPQVNNFVIFDKFFDHHRNDLNRGRNHHGANNHKTNNSSWNPLRPPSGKRSITPSRQLQRENLDIGRLSSLQTNHLTGQQHHMGAGDVLYSRHQVTPPNNRVTPPTSTHANGYFPSNAYSAKRSPSPATGTSPYFNNGNWNKTTSPHMYFATGNSSSAIRNASDVLNHDQNEAQQRASSSMFPPNDENQFFRKGPASTPNCGNRFGIGSDPAFGGGRVPPTSFHQAEQMSESKHDPIVLPGIHSGSANPNALGQNRMPESLAHRPPSGKKNYPIADTSSKSNPPMLQRGGPPHEYKALLNPNPDTVMRNGGAASPYENGMPPRQNPTAVTANGYRGPSKPPYAAASSPFDIPASGRNTSWTVMGVLRDQRLNNNLNSRYNPGRLW